MNNFDFHNPVSILFGKGKIIELNKYIPKESRVLITYGSGSIKRNGVYDQVLRALKGYNVMEFANIEPNPQMETLMKAVKIVKKNNINFLLAVGGGSVIDGTKFIAAAACYKDDDPWEILACQTPIDQAVPFGCVLTLPATGSEMNCGSVITKAATKEKLVFVSPLVYPKFSILDPETTYSLPKRQIANGIVDAYVHVMEQYVTYPTNSPLQDRFAEGILLTLIEEGPKALASEQPDYDNRANLMWAATMALNGLISVGVLSDWATHMIGHELTAFHGIDHGVTLAIVMPGLLRKMKTKRHEKLLQYAERIWNLREGSSIERIEQAIKKTEDFFNQIGVPTHLSDFNVDQNTINIIINRFKERSMTWIGMQQDVAIDDVAEILESRL